MREISGIWPPDSRSTSGFFVLGQEKIKTKAGTFKAQKISYLAAQADRLIITDYWFAIKVGIVLQKSRLYQGGFLLEKSAIELTDREIPE